MIYKANVRLIQHVSDKIVLVFDYKTNKTVGKAVKCLLNE